MHLLDVLFLFFGAVTYVAGLNPIGLRQHLKQNETRYARSSFRQSSFSL